MAQSPLVTSEESVKLGSSPSSSSSIDMVSLKVPIAEAESDSEHQDDEGTSDEESNIEVTHLMFSTEPKVTDCIVSFKSRVVGNEGVVSHLKSRVWIIIHISESILRKINVFGKSSRVYKACNIFKSLKFLIFFFALKT